MVSTRSIIETQSQLALTPIFRLLRPFLTMKYSINLAVLFGLLLLCGGCQPTSEGDSSSASDGNASSEKKQYWVATTGHISDALHKIAD